MIVPRIIRRTVSAWRSWLANMRMRRVMPELADTLRERAIARRQHRKSAALDRRARNIMLHALRSRRSGRAST